MPQSDTLLCIYVTVSASVRPKTLCASYTQMDLKNENLITFLKQVPFCRIRVICRA